MKLRAKLATTFLILLYAAICSLSVVATDRTLRIMAQGLVDSGDRIAKETFEQMRNGLNAAARDPVAAWRADRGLRTAMQSARAFGEYVVYVRIVSADGRILVAAEPDEEGQREDLALPAEMLSNRAASALPLGLLPALWSNRTYEASVPVDLNGQPFASIKVGLSTGLIASDIHRLIQGMLAIALAAMVLSGLAVTVLGNHMMRPVRAITSGVEQLTAGSTEVSVEVGRRDEFGALADKFNQLSRRVRADRSRWESERGHLFDVFRSLSDAVLLIDGDGSLLFANAEARRRLRLDGSGMSEGKPLALLLGLGHPLMQLVGPALSAGTEAHDVALELQGNGAEPACFLVSIFPLGQGATPAGLLVMLRDLERVNELETVVDYSSRLARLGGLLSGVAHQIRNPLNAMTLQLELLSQDAEQGRPVEQRTELMRREIRRLDQAVDALMRLMRPEELKLEEVALNDLLLEIGSRLSQPDVRVDYQLDPDLAPITGDSSLIREALQNLVQNGIQAMPEGGQITLRTSRSGDGFVEIEVADQGAGIPPETLDRIFDLYFTTKEGGTGLGLSLALRAIDLHHGSIRVDSQVGIGTTFKIRLPAAKNAGAAVRE